MFTDGYESTASLLRTSARKVRVGMAALGLAVGLAGPLAQGVEAHDTVSSGTDAYCTTVSVSALYGTSYRYINGAFPTGVTTGATYLAARLQTRLDFDDRGQVRFRSRTGRSWIGSPLAGEAGPADLVVRGGCAP